jgi:CBS domain-containing protein
VTVSDLVATDIVTAHPDDAVTDVVHKMATEDVGSVVIVQRDRPVGIVTDRKITLALREKPDVSRMQVSDLMTEDLFTVSENTNAFDLIRNLSDRGIRRAPVVDEQENLQGIVSLDDVIVLLAEEFHNVGQIIRKQSPRL